MKSFLASKLVAYRGTSNGPVMPHAAGEVVGNGKDAVSSFQTVAYGRIDGNEDQSGRFVESSLAHASDGNYT